MTGLIPMPRLSHSRNLNDVTTPVQEGTVMFEDRIRLAIITGSVRDGRFGPTVATWFSRHAADRIDLDVDIIDLADSSFPPDMTASDDVRAFAERIDSADAFVIVTPEYNHSYPGPLKTAIDSVGNEWKGKPVGFISYGGMSGGLRSVEPLRVVFAELHAVIVRETISFHSAWHQFDAAGKPIDAERVAGAANALLDQLTWWAHALRNARAAHPYGRPMAVSR